MSVIVWDGETMVTDRGAWRDGTVYSMTKLLVNKERTRIVGFAGRTDLAQHAAQMWLDRGELDLLDGEDRKGDFVLMCYDRGQDCLELYDSSVIPAQLDASNIVVAGHQFAAGAVRALIDRRGDAIQAVRHLSEAQWCDVVAFGHDFVRTTRRGNPVASSLPD